MVNAGHMRTNTTPGYWITYPARVIGATMTILRTICPACDVVRVRAEHVTVRRHDHGRGNLEVDFTCPDCAGSVVQQLSARMFPLLVEAGCAVEDFSPIDVEGAISEAEIREFVDELDRLDWADELAY